MPSPFPGMNPYLENEDPWHTFHEDFCTECGRALVPQVRPRYLVQSDENVYIHELSAEERRLVGRPDVFVTRSHGAAAAPGAATAALAVPVYATLPQATEVERDTFLVIRDRQSRELVTVIELLSPTNKRIGPDREQYLAKRRQYLRSDVNLVEIDLLRGGPRMPLDDMPDCDYCIVVSQSRERPRAAVWPVRLRERLPVIPIPLREGDPIPKLDLQQILHQVYDLRGFADYIYSNEPRPPLHPEDAAWARQLIGRGEAPQPAP